VVLAWNTLPLPWRAAHWLEQGSLVHGAVLAAWVVASVALSAWVVSLPAVSARSGRNAA
jgi:hypothetical protein